MLTEEQLGRLWADMAKKEGHRAAVPNMNYYKPKYTDEKRRVQRLRDEGLTHRQIASRMGISRARVSQVLAD